MKTKTRGKALAIGFFDISGFTTLWHEARSRDHGEEDGDCQSKLAQALGDFFSCIIQKTNECGVMFVNTTGDGFLAVSHSTYWSRTTEIHDDFNYHPTRVMYDFARCANSTFGKTIRPFVSSERFVCRKNVQLRTALHYGSVHQVPGCAGSGFFGDSLKETLNKRP